MIPSRSRAMSGSSNGSVSGSSILTIGAKKPALCRHWVSKGQCDLGSSCKFAHSTQDLAQPNTDRTKTQLCSKFSSTGFCQYGDSCNFAHGEAELRAHNSTSMQPGNYKTKMCKTFLSGGPCPSGAQCHYAHGTRELRNMFKPTPSMSQGQRHAGGLGVHGGWGVAPNVKTVLCKNWADGSECSYGDSCTFAHGEEQIQGSKEQRIIARNPLYKTTICKQFAEAEFCELADDCHFAHGEDELRTLRAALHAYKTTVCRNWKTGTCTRGNPCQFAHGEQELSGAEGLAGSAAVSAPGKVGPQYKTSLCKQWSEGESCQYGSDCLFAHGPADLRAFTVPESEQLYKTVLCKNWEAEGKCQWGEQCKWAHGKEDLQTGGQPRGHGHPKTPSSSWNSQHKTVLCTKWAEGSCQYGARCMFAHGQAELRTGGRQVTLTITSPQYKTVLCQQAGCQFGESCTFAHSQAELRTVQQNLAQINPNYKGTLCKYFMSTGECEFGTICQYAHGNMELRNIAMGGSMMGMTSKQVNHNYSQQMEEITSPQYKTTLCKNYQDSGKCDFAARCQFAHGQLELRTLGQNYLQLNPQYKTVMCSHFTEHGSCPQGHNCQFSHGIQELRQPVGQDRLAMDRGQPGPASRQSELGAGGRGAGVGESGAASGYKTQPCRNIKDSGHCSYGPVCQFAHSIEEMRIAGAAAARRGEIGLVGGGKPVKVVLCQQYKQGGNCERGGSCQFAHGLMELHEYRARQVPNYKTTLCQLWSSTGQCSYGDTCMYAHGRGQLRVGQGQKENVQFQDRNKASNMSFRRQGEGPVWGQQESKRFRM